MYKSLQPILDDALKTIKESGLHKDERILSSRQGRAVMVNDREYLNFCSNNYLGLAGLQGLIEAAKDGLDKYGFGLSSVRFICGTQDIHKELEKKTAWFVGMDDTILYSSCMAANLGFFNAFLGEEDAILSDSLNHASIIDGIRMSKAERFIYKHMDMRDLERGLFDNNRKRIRCIVTDGVFSMDGDIAPLREICELAEKYDALVVVDDSHATGFMGENGGGTHEYREVLGKVDVIISTYGKALGGAAGGFVAGPMELIDLLRQRSRSYLFSNSLPPVVAAGAWYAIHYIEDHPEIRGQLWENLLYFRREMEREGFDLPKSAHPIVPIILKDAQKTKLMAEALFEEGIYVVSFSYPVVPENEARIRVQISNEHTVEDIDKLVKAFVKNRYQPKIVGNATPNQ
jgi:glycine C-acetyltransferase